MKKSYAEKHKRRGRKPKLSIENQLLAALEYWHEYRTYAHIAASYGIAESNIYRSIKWIEDTLIKDGTFRLPGKKELVKEEADYEIGRILFYAYYYTIFPQKINSYSQKSRSAFQQKQFKLYSYFIHN